MMGPTKLHTMREEVRQAMKMSDAELLAWFHRQLEELGHKPKANPTALETLRLLRDALVTEAQRAAPRRRGPRGISHSRS